MWLRRFGTEGFRHLVDASVEFEAGCNLLVGGNGAGKTSVLEGIYVLDRGKSFRSRKAGPVVKTGCRVGKVVGVACDALGQDVEWSRRVGGEGAGGGVSEDQRKAREKPKGFRVRLVNDSAYVLVEGGPELRRRFLDWNLFHVEQRHARRVQEFRRILQQRNAWLRGGAKGSPVWDQPYVTAAKALNQSRSLFASELGKELRRFTAIADFWAAEVELEWQAGFSPESFADNLRRDLARDRQLGFTFAGPERADWRVLVGGDRWKGSRGENKALAILLQLAADAAVAGAGDGCVWLVDDLASELSADRTQTLRSLIEDKAEQTFLTQLDAATNKPYALFHVEQGKLTRRS